MNKSQPHSRVAQEAGTIDILVNNVWGGYERMMEDGVFTWSKPFWEQPLWRWDAMFDAGVRAHYYASQLAARSMVGRRRGLIVNISFWAAQKHIGNVAYGVSKAATDKMTADMATELLRALRHHLRDDSVHAGGSQADPAEECEQKRQHAPDSQLHAGALLHGLYIVYRHRSIGAPDGFANQPGGGYSGTVMPDLAAELQRIYDNEINVRAFWFWCGGFTVQLGDQMNGYEAEETVGSVAEILPWLQAAIAHFYPSSAYARSLDSEIRQRGAEAIFRPPRVGLSVRCPHWGSPNAAASMFDQVDIFVCNHCGQSVEVPRPRPQ